ncbi:DUF5808 domain-containing protein [Sporolactobacillus putidus]|uniref:Membrane protein n=1 Tax=Sporolactobacillus putidus TaxID=492735 RepID=A0A917S9A3_9BACL|nr:DUF5808 domain-containing protein [Sporolactobacillus putidus]GGL65146.1 membrane protein [Sporolactobacillus putidus]
MNGGIVTFVAANLVIASLFVIQPWFSRKNVLFGVVFGDDSIWRDEKAKRIRKRYLWEAISGALLVCLGFFIYFIQVLPARGAGALTSNLSVFALILVETLVFIAANRRTRRFKNKIDRDARLVSNKVIIETDINEKETVVPGWWLLLLLPVFLASLAVALLGYSMMPDKIPTHYSFTAVNGWSHKSLLTIMTPVIIEAVLSAIIFVSCFFTRRAPASVRGNPDAAPDSYRFRKVMVVMMLSVGVLLELNFLITEIGFITPVAPLWFTVMSIAELVMFGFIVLFYFRFVRLKKPSGPILDDDRKWLLGIVYFNPSDPSIFVEKRVGIGYTVNCARPAAWILIAGTIVLIVFITVFSAHVK